MTANKLIYALPIFHRYAYCLYSFYKGRPSSINTAIHLFRLLRIYITTTIQ